MSETNKRPIEEIKHGRLLASIWSNDREDGTRDFSVTIERMWKGDHAKWHYSRSLWEEDLGDEQICTLAALARNRIEELRELDDVRQVARDHPEHDPASKMFKQHTSWQQRQARRL